MTVFANTGYEHVVSTQEQTPSARRYLIVDLVCVLVLVGICLAIGLPRYRAGMDWGDEGFLAYGGVHVMEGQLPHRDFVSLQPPLSFYVAAITFKILGTSLASLRTLGLSIYVLIPLLIYACARNLMPPLFAIAAALPAIILGIPSFNFVPYAVWQGITLTLAVAALYLYALHSRYSWLALFAGMLTTISIFLRHDQGIYLAISILILMPALYCAKQSALPVHELKRALVWWSAGALPVALGFTIYWLAKGALPEMFRQLIVFPLATYRKTSSEPFPLFSSQASIYQNSLTVLYYLPLLFFALSILWLARQILRRTFYWNEAILTFLTAWSAFFYCQVLTRSDVSHLLITLPPFFVLAAFCWRILFEKLGQKTMLKFFMSILAVSAASCYLWAVSRLTLPGVTHELETLDLRRGGVRIENAWTAAFVHDIQKYVPPDRSILALPYQPMFYFLCERRNPTRWNYLWPGDQTPADHEELIQQAKSDPPAVVLISDEKEMASYAPTILDYVHREYRHAADFGPLSVYVPQQPRP